MTHALTYFRRFAGLNRPVKLLLVNSFVIALTVFGGISSVLQNLYLLRLGHSLEFIGLYSAIALLVFSAFCLPAGALSQRIGLRQTLVLGVGVITAGWVIILLAPSLPMDWQLPLLMVGNAIAAAGMALRFTSMSPMIAVLAQPSDRTYAFSANSVVTTLGAIAGSLLAGFLPLLLGSLPGLALDQVSILRWTLLISTFIVLLSAVPILMIGKQSELTPALANPNPMKASEHDENERAGRRAIVMIIFAVAFVLLLQMAGEGLINTFANVYLDQGLGVPLSQIGLLMALTKLLAIPAALATPLLATRWGNARAYLYASIGIAIAILPLALLTNQAAAGMGLMCIAALTTVRGATSGVFQMELVPNTYRPMMSSAVLIAIGLSWAAMALGGSAVIQHNGFTMAFLMGAGLTMLGTVLFAVIFRKAIWPRAMAYPATLVSEIQA